MNRSPEVVDGLLSDLTYATGDFVLKQLATDVRYARKFSRCI